MSSASLPPVTLPPVLLGLFRELAAYGVPVGTRAYLDGVRALSLGFGGGNRNELRRLALTLWARSEEEQRIIAHWFDVLSAPRMELVDEVDAALQKARAGFVAAPAVADDHDAGADGARAAAGARSGAGARGSDAAADEPDASRVRLSFASHKEGTGLPVPRLPAEPFMGENYVLHPHTSISLREMVVLWRRHRRGTRRGPSTELDLAATLLERCRCGLLRKPLFRPRRSNCARLLVLADVSASMDPWRPFLASLAESLQFGRLARAEVRYFSNLPRNRLFVDAELSEAEMADDVYRRLAGASLMVVSDGGSARGFLNRRRAMQTHAFLGDIVRRFSATVWLNPMPRSRWDGTTAGLIAGSPAPMLPLDAVHLLRAVDILRGNK